jgi:hypothetical protein
MGAGFEPARCVPPQLRQASYGKPSSDVSTCIKLPEMVRYQFRHPTKKVKKAPSINKGRQPTNCCLIQTQKDQSMFLQHQYFQPKQYLKLHAHFHCHVFLVPTLGLPVIQKQARKEKRLLLV